MDKEQVISLVKNYKKIIAEEFNSCKVMLYGSYSKDTAHEGSDIDVAVIVPTIGDEWLAKSSKLWYATLKVSTLIEPVLLEEGENSPLYRDIMRSGIAI